MSLVVRTILLTLILSSNIPFSCIAQNVSVREERTLVEENTEMITPNTDILKKWEKLEKGLKDIVRTAIKAMLPRVMESSTTTNISMSCIRDVMKLISGLKDIRAWAFRFLDSTAKSADGILSGTVSNFGSYDECINTKAINERKGKNYGEVLFRGQYCAVDIKPPLPPKTGFYKLGDVMEELKNFSTRGTAIAEAAKYAHMFHFIPLRIGICVPTGCSVNDVSQVLQQRLLMQYATSQFHMIKRNKYFLKDFTEREIHQAKKDTKEPISSIGGTAAVKRCEVKEENKFTPLIIGVISMSSFLGLLMVIGTLIDIYAYYSKKKFNNLPFRIPLCFSFMSNFKKLFNTESASEKISCLNGMRFLSMSWIVLGHNYGNVNFQLFRGLEYVTAFSRDFAFQAIGNASVAVDTFFFMGGMVVCYVTINISREFKKPFSVPFYIFHRFWRLMPVYAFVIAVIFLCPIMGSGPIYHDTLDHFIDSCHRNWWTNLLFINNYYNVDDMCLPQSWYIASDMQLYIFALIILLPMLRWPKVGLMISVLGILASIISSGLITYINDFPATMLLIHPDPEQLMTVWSSLYYKPYPHAAPYCIGIIAGYFLATRPSIRIPKIILTVGWCFAIVCNMSVLYGVLEWNRGTEPSFWERIIYSSCHRVGWTLGVAWIILTVGWCFAIMCNMSVLYGVLEWNRGTEPSFWERIIYSSCHRVGWTLGVAWVIMCCSYGYGGVVNYILCWKVWIPLGRLTYITYLIHPIVQLMVISNFRASIQPAHYFAVWIYFGNLVVTYAVAFAGCVLVEAPFLSLEKIFMPRDKGQRVEKPSGNTNHIINGLKQDKKREPVTVLNISEICNNEKGTENVGFVYKL